MGKPTSQNITVTFDQPVIIAGVPDWTDNKTVPNACDSITLTAPNVAVLHFTGAVSTSLTIPFEDPSIRNSAGGYVLSGSFPVGS